MAVEYIVRQAIEVGWVVEAAGLERYEGRQLVAAFSDGDGLCSWLRDRIRGLVPHPSEDAVSKYLRELENKGRRVNGNECS